MERPICTLVHISDPHFGSSFVNDGETWWHRTARMIPGIRHVSGLYPHDYNVAGALAVAVRSILRDRRDRGIPAVVVHTGDLTATGSHAEFSAGRTFLLGGHYLENGSISGLKLDTEFGQPSFDIPGNHDLWRRRGPKDHGAFTSCYGGAYPRILEIKTGGGTVVLHGLDSNRSSLWQHRLANGEIPSAQFNSLLDALRASHRQGAVQVVCLHHPISLRPRTVPRIGGREILKLRARDSVGRSLFSAGVSLVLAGHVHNQQHRRRAKDRPLHFIAGSACQLGCRPSFWMLDLYPTALAFTYLHIPRGRIHFEPASSRSGATHY